jgi:hypothetical protein
LRGGCDGWESQNQIAIQKQEGTGEDKEKVSERPSSDYSLSAQGGDEPKI